MKRLYRTNGMLLGVCEGLGEYFNIDPVIIRLIFIIMPSSLLIYIIAGVIIPKKPM